MRAPQRHAAVAAALFFLTSLAACGSGGDGSAGFGGGGVLEEEGRIDQSSDPEWWLSSGALFFRSGDSARTIQGDLPPDSPWRGAYSRSNSRDSAGGARPQNLFRLVHRRSFANLDQQVSFLVQRTDASSSPNRNASNGVFLFQRYLGENDLYASGVRVDGAAAIKKKSGGRTHTLASRPLFGNGAPYDRGANPNVLPPGRWIHLRTEALDDPQGVRLRLFVDGTLAVETIDDGRGAEGPLLGSGLAGVRGDFMDLELRGYAAEAR
ncbi:MAG: hypothetical protein ACREQ9_25275 [Candidatus Binatia bacterium]